MRLLVAEDDARLLKSLMKLLEMDHYTVDGVSNGEDAFEYARTGEYDGLILDVMMPEMDGLTVLRRLRQSGIGTPTLFLSARTEVYQRVEGLDAGADDYLPKPFSTPELLARVRAMLRRREHFTPDLLTVCGVTLDRSTFDLCFAGQKQVLSAREMQVMEMLMQAPRTILGTEQLLTHVWGWDASVDTSVVWVHISNIRKKLDAIGAPLRIRFVRQAGYTLEEIK